MKTKIQNYIKTWEQRCYSDGIPNEVPIRLMQLNKAPNYKQICIAILKNDRALETLGFSRTKSLVYSELKKNRARTKKKLFNSIKAILNELTNYI